MLYEERLGSKNEISIRAKNLYQKKSIQIMEDVTSKWHHEKMVTKLIIDRITDGNERYIIYWEAWKKCSSLIENDSAILKYTGYFINDLLDGSPQFKKIIEVEMLNLISSENKLLAKRVKNLHSIFL
jgi:hypothetical protein